MYFVFEGKTQYGKKKYLTSNTTSKYKTGEKPTRNNKPSPIMISNVEAAFLNYTRVK